MNQTCRADMHVHSTASQLSKLGVQRSLHLPECATPPEQVYELAKRQGMDFVTITDHDTIAGAEAIAHLDDTFISEELTVGFKGRGPGERTARGGSERGRPHVTDLGVPVPLSR